MTETRELTLRADDSTAERVLAEPVGPRSWRLAETPILAQHDDGDETVHAGDTVELEPRPDGTYRLIRVVERSPARHYSWMIPRALAESAELGRFTDAVEAAGGTWEQAALHPWSRDLTTNRNVVE